jgi:hypothetical protein
MVSGSIFVFELVNPTKKDVKKKDSEANEESEQSGGPTVAMNRQQGVEKLVFYLLLTNAVFLA